MSEASADPLDGAHVLLTGATGFLGQALLERLLSSYPTTRISLLVRARGSSSGSDRLAGLMRKSVFSTWKKTVGAEAAAEQVARRVRVIDGELGAVGFALPDDLTAIIHAASTVSFDPPIDDAFRTNVQGVVDLYEAVRAAGCHPHVVHVSTAYVAGARKGVVPELSLDHHADWRTELAAALAARADVERDSRRPEALRKALDKARREHGKSGPQSAAKAAEEARGEWVTDRLVDYGRLRAQSLGWPDVYTFTKALGERVAEELLDGVAPLSVVRPAIVESALVHPYPGWLDGFKMADPLILAFGRGILSEFPGVPDGALDLIPVDIVVNACLAVAAAPPAPEQEPHYYHIGSGARNPLTFRDMYQNIHEYFTDHPMPDGGRGQIKPPIWTFPGARRVDRMLRTGERVLDAAEKALLSTPSSPRTRRWQSDLRKQQDKVEFLRRYSDLYGVYTESEVIYTDNRLLALHRSLSPERQAEHGFDSAVVDWVYYLQKIHCPAITVTMRKATTGRRTTSGALPGLEPIPDGAVAAVFDLEGTVVASNVIEAYLWAKLSDLPRGRWPEELTDLARKLPRYLLAERRDRGEFLRTFVRRYAGVREAALAELVGERLGDALLRRAHPEAIRRIRKHRAAGHRTVLITGTVDVLVEPLAVLFDEVVASRLHARDGVYTGFLDMPPLVGEARAAWLRRYAGAAGLDLTRSFAYGDSYSDRPLLECVGHPVAVNPDGHLYRHARSRHWPVASWKSHALPALEALGETVRP